MRPGLSAFGASRHHERIGLIDLGVSPNVFPYQCMERKDPLQKSVIVSASYQKMFSGRFVGFFCKGTFQSACRSTSPFFQDLDQPILSLCSLFLEIIQEDSGFLPLRPDESEGGAGHADRNVVEKAFVDISDLFHVECPERQTSGFLAPFPPLHLEELERFEKMKDRPVVDRKRVGRGILPRASLKPSFEEWKTVGIEEASTQCGKTEHVMIEPCVYSPERGEKSGPSVLPTFKDFDSDPVGLFTNTSPQCRNRIMSIVGGVPQEKQAPLLGAKKKHQPHHHRERRVVQPARRNPFEELPAPIHIGSIQCLDEDLHGSANLVPELIGDLLLVRNRLLKHLLERIGVGHGEEPACTEERQERSKSQRFLEPKEP